MNVRHHHALAFGSCISVAAFLVAGHVTAASDPSQARVTRIIREVKLLPAKSTARPAAIDDKVSEGTGVRTGDESRSELTFVDLTITRLGANSIFSFNRAGRSVDLGGGSVLLRVPKDSGGARISTSAVTVGVTGTTVIMESVRRNKLIVLEGSARINLRKFPMESATLRGGQMIDVPPGATTLPPVVNIDVNEVMKKNPLITDFPPLPSRDLIYASKPNPPPGQPAGGGSGGGISVNVPIVGNLVGPVPFRPDFGRHDRHKPTRGEGTRGGVKGEGSSTNDGVATGSKGSQPKASDGTSSQALSRGKVYSKPTPAPSRVRKRKTHGGY